MAALLDVTICVVLRFVCHAHELIEDFLLLTSPRDAVFRPKPVRCIESCRDGR